MSVFLQNLCSQLEIESGLSPILAPWSKESNASALYFRLCWLVLLLQDEHVKFCPPVTVFFSIHTPLNVLISTCLVQKFVSLLLPPLKCSANDIG
jgi:hypothetical protein